MNKTLISLMCILFLSACNLPGVGIEAGSTGPFAWIDAPLTGTTLGVNQAVQVVSHSSASAGLSQVELSVNGVVISTDPVASYGSTYVLMKQKWSPAAPGQYDLRVRSLTTGQAWSAYALVHVTVNGDESSIKPTFAAKVTATPSASLTPRLVPSLVPSLVASDTPTLTATTGMLLFTPTRNANCRSGPATNFATVGVLPAGQPVNIVGKLQDGTWLVVAPANLPQCWVSSGLGQASGDLSGVPVLVSPPTPTPALPIFGSPSLSGSSLYNITGCGEPTSVTVSISIQNATSATLNYQVGGASFNLAMTSGGGSNWSASLHSDPALAPYTGSVSFSVDAFSGSLKASSAPFGGLTLQNCKP